MRMISGSSALYRLFIRAISNFHMFVYRSTGGVVSVRLGLPTARFILPGYERPKDGQATHNPSAEYCRRRKFGGRGVVRRPG